jgi:hypothetical protein
MPRRTLAALAGTAIALLVAAAAPVWSVVPSVDPVTTGNQLTAVSARTATDAWTVGFYRGTNRHDGRVMLAERWDGTRWTQYRRRTSRSSTRKLLAVGASGADGAWAVGSTNQTTGFATTNDRRVLERNRVVDRAHYGHERVGQVDPGRGRRVGPGNAWAAWRGRDEHALVEHWNGMAWSVVTTT